MVAVMFFVYAGIGAAALLILILLGIFGGLDLDFDLDIGDADLDIDGGGSLGLPVVLAFLAVFGGVSAILTFFGVHDILAPVIGGVSAIAMAFLLFLAVRYFLKLFSADSTVKYKKLVGKKATVTITIKPGQEGQVTLFTEQRGRTLVPAVSSNLVKTNTEVMISESLGDKVKVVTIDKWRRTKRSKTKEQGKKGK